MSSRSINNYGSFVIAKAQVRSSGDGNNNYLGCLWWCVALAKPDWQVCLSVVSGVRS